MSANRGGVGGKEAPRLASPHLAQGIHDLALDEEEALGALDAESRLVVCVAVRPALNLRERKCAS